jgi:hypothetical protein
MMFSIMLEDLGLQDVRYNCHTMLKFSHHMLSLVCSIWGYRWSSSVKDGGELAEVGLYTGGGSVHLAWNEILFHRISAIFSLLTMSAIIAIVLLELYYCGPQFFIRPKT